VILVDTGPLVAVLNADDHRHLECMNLLEQTSVPIIVPMTVAVEVCQIAERVRGPQAEAAFLQSVAAGERTVEPIGSADLVRAAELVETYADLRLGLVDASLVAIAERLNITTIATLDRRDFHVVRPRHVDAFELIP
jgi:predicted nucleic acid-binding protein